MKKWTRRIGCGCGCLGGIAVWLVMIAVGIWWWEWSQIATAADPKSFTYDGLERYYAVYIPDSVDPTTPAPVVFVLHGGGGTAENTEKLTEGQFNDLADEYGFIVVYGEGIEEHWNDGRQTNWRAHQDNIDDVGYMAAVLDDLEPTQAIDRAHVFATGISNGGQMSYRLACDVSDKFAAVAPVSANMGLDYLAVCAPTTPISLIIFNGTNDQLIEYDGGTERVAGADIEYGPVEDTVAFWVNHNNCPTVPTVESLPDTAPRDGTRVTRYSYAPCDAGTSVVFYKIEGGGHTWPDGFQYLPRAVIGRTSRDINASALIWAFFQSQIEKSSGVEAE